MKRARRESALCAGGLGELPTELLGAIVSHTLAPVHDTQYNRLTIFMSLSHVCRALRACFMAAFTEPVMRALLGGALEGRFCSASLLHSDCDYVHYAFSLGALNEQYAALLWDALTEHARRLLEHQLSRLHRPPARASPSQHFLRVHRSELKHIRWSLRAVSHHSQQLTLRQRCALLSRLAALVPHNACGRISVTEANLAYKPRFRDVCVYPSFAQMRSFSSAPDACWAKVMHRDNLWVDLREMLPLPRDELSGAERGRLFCVRHFRPFEGAELGDDENWGEEACLTLADRLKASRLFAATVAELETCLEAMGETGLLAESAESTDEEEEDEDDW